MKTLTSQQTEVRVNSTPSVQILKGQSRTQETTTTKICKKKAPSVLVEVQSAVKKLDCIALHLLTYALKDKVSVVRPPVHSKSANAKLLLIVVRVLNANLAFIQPIVFHVSFESFLLLLTLRNP